MARLYILHPLGVDSYIDGIIALGKDDHAAYARRYNDWVEAGRTDTHPRREVDIADTARCNIEHDVDRLRRGDDIRESSSYQRYYVDRYMNKRKPVRRTPSRLRDSQRSKVYAAERASIQSAPEERFRNLSDIEHYLVKMISSAWWQRRYPVRSIAVKSGAGTRNAMGTNYSRTRGMISIPLWARQETVILHEVAHVVAGATYGSIPAHGREFCKVFLDLIRWRMGDEAWRSLKDEFRERKVKHTLASRTREMSEEQKQAARERLAAARSKKEKA